MALQSFEQFAKTNSTKIAAELESNNTVVREESARSFRDLLKEYGVTKVSELEEENREEFFNRIQGIKVNESGVYSFNGANILESIEIAPEFEDYMANEAVIITGKRDAKKVFNQYVKIFNEYSAFSNKNSKLHALGVLKQIYFDAMEDANFSREAYPTMKKIKGNIGKVVVKLAELKGMEIKIPGSKITFAISQVAGRISNAAGWSGIGIVEGTALYLESIGEPKIAEDLVNLFQAQFEGEDVRVDISSKLNESKKIVEGAVKRFEMDLNDMIKDIKRGYGWIDPEFVADTWENTSDSIDFELVKGEIYKRLIAAGLLAHAADDNEEEAGKYVKNLKELGIKESVVTEGKGFKNTKDFEDFLEEIDGMGEAQIKKIMGKDYIDTPGFYQDEKDNYEDIIDFMISNMGDSEFEKLQDWWENNVQESVVTEAKFVKDFNRDVLKAKTKEEVLELYPNAEFFIGKSDHFFGELDGNLFFKAYYTKAQKEFEIKSVYSEKGSNYVHLYNESIVTEAEIEEGNAFGDAVRKAKEAGDKEFDFDGKTYKVTESTMLSSEWIVGETYPEYGTVISITNNGGVQEIRFESGEVIKYGFGVKVEESIVNEAEVTSDEDFKEYATNVLQKAFGKDFDEAKANEVIDGILGKVDGDYGAAVGMLTSSLG